MTRLDWNFAGWFGSQLGATAWILVAAAIAMGHDLPTGSILVVIFAIPNAVGLALWRRRYLSCYVSTQILIALCGGFGLLAIYLLERNGLWLKIQQGGAISAPGGYFLLTAVVAIVMVYFHLRFARGSTRDPP